MIGIFFSNCKVLKQLQVLKTNSSYGTSLTFPFEVSYSHIDVMYMNCFLSIGLIYLLKKFGYSFLV